MVPVNTPFNSRSNNMTNTDTRVAERLYRHRTRRHLTQQQVADAIGVSKASVSNWEGGVKNPRMSNLEQIAELFGTSVSGLMRR